MGILGIIKDSRFQLIGTTRLPTSLLIMSAIASGFDTQNYLQPNPAALQSVSKPSKMRKQHEM